MGTRLETFYDDELSDDERAAGADPEMTPEQVVALAAKYDKRRRLREHLDDEMRRGALGPEEDWPSGLFGMTGEETI